MSTNIETKELNTQQNVQLNTQQNTQLNAQQNTQQKITPKTKTKTKPINRILTKSEIENIKETHANNAPNCYLVVKRFIDILAGIIGCIIMIPMSILLFFSNLINRENGPMFYNQKRIGKDGKVFTMYKYRTMVVNADEILEDYLNNHEKEKEEYIIYRKLKNDPRITKMGLILRKTSLDEWPQFINVLKGDMSLVGARPYLLKEKKYLEDDSVKILAFRPGLTGPWQVAGRSNLKFADRIKIEKNYVPSFTGDMKIVIATVKKVFKMDGAY